MGAWLVALMLLGVQPQEIITDIRVHGNVATSDEEIRRMAGVEIGAPLQADTVTAAAERLRATKRFVRVDVLKRFASIEDPTQIVLVIIVDEGAVKIERTGDSDAPVRVVKTRGPRLMFLPIIIAEDGYGLIAKVRSMEVDSQPSIPAVAITAYAKDEDRQRALESGFQIYLAKPVELSELISVVARAAKRDF